MQDPQILAARYQTGGTTADGQLQELVILRIAVLGLACVYGQTDPLAGKLFFCFIALMPRMSPYGNPPTASVVGPE